METLGERIPAVHLGLLKPDWSGSGTFLEKMAAWEVVLTSYETQYGD